MTTPTEKDAMALAVFDAENAKFYKRKLDAAEAELASANAKLDASIATGNSLIAEREILYRKLGEAEAELAAVREWLAKLESFVGPGALAYMRREFDAARGANK